MPMTPVIIPMPVHSGADSDTITQIEICKALPTKAETLVCLQDLKRQQDHDSFVAGSIIGIVVLAFIIGLIWVACHD